MFVSDNDEEYESLWEKAGDWIVTTLHEAEGSIHNARKKFLHGK
jgi:hypothetical protein